MFRRMNLFPACFNLNNSGVIYYFESLIPLKKGILKNTERLCINSFRKNKIVTVF